MLYATLAGTGKIMLDVIRKCYNSCLDFPCDFGKVSHRFENITWFIGICSYLIVRVASVHVHTKSHESHLRLKRLISQRHFQYYFKMTMASKRSR